MPDSSVKTLSEGLDVLESLSSGELGITELSTRHKLSKSAVHRLVRTLTERNYVAQNPSNRKYRLGWKMFEIANGSVDAADVYSVVRMEMRRLNELTKETVHSAVLDRGDVIYIDKAQGTRDIVVSTRVGARVSAYAAATGKALLAYQPAAYLKRYLPAEFTPFTVRTCKSMEDLQVELEDVRRRGFAINRGERREDVCSIAAPVFDRDGDAVAAISVLVPRSSFDDTLIERLGRSVLYFAASAGRHLGTTHSPLPLDRETGEQLEERLANSSR